MPSTFSSSNGDAYEMQMGRWSRRLAPHFLRFSGITGAECVLDVGCGTGSLSACIAEVLTATRVHGIDLSTAYVEHAQRHHRDARLTFATGDAGALPFPDAAFDHVLSMLVLQFTADPLRVADEMRRVTRRGGTVAAATWDARGGFVAQRMILDTAAAFHPEGNARRAAACTRRMSRPGELADAWHRAGLTDVVQDMLTIRMDFVSFADFWSPNEGTEGPIADYVGTLDDATKTKLRRKVEQAYLDGEPDGPRSYAATAWAVKGTVP
jgi:ubiquinone/menaquinone biosynthesis C-methylase UbiE